MENPALHFELKSSIHDFPADQWNQISVGQGPFLRHEFLSALEDSDSVSGESGWIPAHLGVYQKAQLIGIAPLYIKEHSYGEYVFDFAWANAYHQHGLEYYPKLINAIPFTPVTGERLVFKAEFNKEEMVNLAIKYIGSQLEQRQLSSFHCLFPPRRLSDTLKSAGIPQRFAVQFQWFNREYLSFDHYLQGFTARRRKSIKKERKKIAAQGMDIRRISGRDITLQDMELFYQCYMQTYLKRSGHTGYLTRTFFTLLLDTMADNLLLVIAYKRESPVASALCLFDEHQLCGRYWGALEDVDGLHFECCYYQGIEFCIERNIQTYNPGTQGEHKILRGFEPIFTFSNHLMADNAFHHAVERFVHQEQPGIEHYKSEAESLLPFKTQE